MLVWRLLLCGDNLLLINILKLFGLWQRLFIELPCEFSCVRTLLKAAWTVAIETLSWIELQKLSERSALARTVRQLGIRNPNAVRYAYGLVCETLRRKNLFCGFTFTKLESPKTGLNSTWKRRRASLNWAERF